MDVPPENVMRKGRLKPGEMFLVNFAQKRVIEDSELKQQFCSANPYGDWLQVSPRPAKLDESPLPPIADISTWCHPCSGKASPWTQYGLSSRTVLSQTSGCSCPS